MSKTVKKQRNTNKPRKRYKRKVVPVLNYFDPVTEYELKEFDNLARSTLKEDLELGYFNHR